MNEVMTTKHPRLQFSAEDRWAWTEKHKLSGQSVRAFCHDHAACQSSLSRWLRQRRAGTNRRRQEGSLVEVRVAPTPSSAAASIKACLRGGITIEVASGTDATLPASALLSPPLSEG